MNTNIVIQVATKLLKKKFPWLLYNNKIEAYKSSNHIAFGGRSFDTYGWLEKHGVVITATAFSPYMSCSKEFEDLTSAIEYCIKFHFGYNKKLGNAI